MQLNALDGQGRGVVGLEHSSQEMAPPPSQPSSWQPVPTEHPQCQAWHAPTFLHLSLWWPGGEEQGTGGWGSCLRLTAGSSRTHPPRHIWRSSLRASGTRSRLLPAALPGQGPLASTCCVWTTPLPGSVQTPHNKLMPRRSTAAHRSARGSPSPPETVRPRGGALRAWAAVI